MPVDITEYESLAIDSMGNKVPTGAEPSLGNQQVTISVSSVQSAVFKDTTRFVRIHTDGNVRIQIGDNPTATGSSMRMSAGSTEFFGVRPGHKLAAIQTA